MSTTEKKRAVSVTPFAIEAKTPRNQDLMIQNLGRLRLRGGVSASIEAFDRNWEDEDQDDDEMPTRPTSAKLIEGIGELPGMQLYVNPAELEWKTADPLFKNERLLERIGEAIRRYTGMGNVSQKLKGIKSKSGKLGKDEMKSLCKELLCFIEAGEAKVVKGVTPSMEDVEELPGEFLLNWSNTNQWRQPRLEKDYGKWVDRMGHIEGDG